MAKTGEEIPGAARGATVLVVEDEASVRAFVSETLAGQGYAVIEAADSKAGLRLLRSDICIDALVTDIGLPGGMDGHRMVVESRAARPGLPVLFMTGYARPEVLENSPLEPAGLVLTKPFALEALLRGVEALLKR